jgi:aspartyl-tRNA(Asn)/glutamyl-tRNA(Gln) amidotransferase subunit B
VRYVLRPLETTLNADYEPVIGLEVHCQLLTATKIFCACPNRFGDEPNTNVCPVCLGLPGALPVLSREAVELAVRAALALRCTVHEVSVFARKNYFYPDLPKGYQISQFERPLATQGHLELPEAGRRVRLQRIHMEEDAGKLLHDGLPWSGDQSGVDLNRSGVPLIEIVSHPDLRSGAEAHEYLAALRAILVYASVSDGNMEEGSLRCDANVSVRRLGTETLGTRTEVKNLNSFRHVARAIEHEVARQVAVIESGGRVEQETRLWDADREQTLPMRSKEESHDYRYFPEPDLPPLVVSRSWVDEIGRTLPELPAERRRRFEEAFGLPGYDAAVLTQTRELADYFEAAASGCGDAKAASNWVMTEILRKLKEDDQPLSKSKVTPLALAELVNAVKSGAISGKIAKDVFEKMWASGEAPEAIIARDGLRQVSDQDALGTIIARILEENPVQVATYRSGKKGTLGWFVGQVMRETQGQANPKLVNEMLRAALDAKR